MTDQTSETPTKDAEEGTFTAFHAHQRILFGSPGTGKSHKVHNEYLQEVDAENVFKTVFHPEYKYGDFMGRLMPLTVGGSVRYEYQAGHFMKALAKAYINLIKAGDKAENVKKVALVIDEINRGNSAAIFGTAFQLLDREKSGWSTYQLDISDLEKEALLSEMGYKPDPYNVVEGRPVFKDKQEITFEGLGDDILKDNNKIRIPPNLSIFATMNTSDESIYYMDSAFKRRWDWEFVPVDGQLNTPKGELDKEWQKFVNNLNTFIKDNSKHIRKVEDKLIGHYFIKAPYTYEKIQSKLMFFLWDSVFSQDKKPLQELLKDDEGKEPELITFGDFANQVKTFVSKIETLSAPNNDWFSKS